MTSLSGKVAWVTGAGSGIGEAAAVALAGAGATIVLTGRRKEALDAVAKKIETARGRAHVEAGDVTDAKRVNAIAEAIRSAFGRLDIVVNNAGTNLRERRWAELTPERIDTILEGNLSSAFYVAAAALPMMRAQKDGVIIHTASWRRTLRQPAERTRVQRSQARAGGCVAQHQHGGMQKRFSLLCDLSGRGGNADSRKPSGPGEYRGARPHAAAGGSRRPHPVRGDPAQARVSQRGAHQPDVEPGLYSPAGHSGGSSSQSGIAPENAMEPFECSGSSRD